MSILKLNNSSITPTSRLFGWGYNNDYWRTGKNDGVAGNGGIITVPEQIGSPDDAWIDVTAGGGAPGNSGWPVYAIRSDGKLFAWGKGALGNGQYLLPNYYLGSGLVQIGTDTWTKVVSNGPSTLAIRSDGKLFGWGSQFPNGIITGSLTPIQIRSGSIETWNDIEMSNWSVLAIRSDGKLFTWGYNYSGVLGDGSFTPKFYPQQIGIIKNGIVNYEDSWTKIFLGLEQAFAIRSDGKLFGWGFNMISDPSSPLAPFIPTGSFWNMLGDPTITTKNVLRPTQIGNNSWSTISIRKGSVIGIRSDGKLFGWGDLYKYGVKSNFIKDNWVSSPVQINNFDWIDIKSGFCNLGIRSDGKLFAWSDGELANQASEPAPFFVLNGGTAVQSRSPVLVSTPPNGTGVWSKISINENFAYIISAEPPPVSPTPTPTLSATPTHTPGSTPPTTPTNTFTPTPTITPSITPSIKQNNCPKCPFDYYEVFKDAEKILCCPNDWIWNGTKCCPPIEPTPTSTPQSTPTSTPQSTPTSTPQSTPTSTPQSTPTSTPQSTPTSTPQSTPEPTPQPTSEPPPSPPSPPPPSPPPPPPSPPSPPSPPPPPPSPPSPPTQPPPTTTPTPASPCSIDGYQIAVDDKGHADPQDIEECKNGLPPYNRGGINTSISGQIWCCVGPCVTDVDCKGDLKKCCDPDLNDGIISNRTCQECCEASDCPPGNECKENKCVPKKAVRIEGAFSYQAWGSYCCDVNADSPPAAGGCRKDKMSIGSLADFEVVSPGTPLLDGGVAGISTVTVKANTGVMVDNYSVNADGVELAASTNGDAPATVPVGTTTLDGYVQECYLQTGGWVTLPGKQGTDHIGSIEYELFVWAGDEDIIL